VSNVVEADSERRFGGLRRLYGDAGYARIRAAHVVVVGVGGVGSWAVEALARSGVAMLTLIDLDQVSESNINRQVQALGITVGQSKTVALRQRIADIHPGCVVHSIEEFVDETNWPGLMKSAASAVTSQLPSAVIDACDQVRAKAVLAAWAIATGTPLVSVGAAGGKQAAQAVEVADLADVTHDPLLASLRQRLRQHHAAARKGALGVRCVFSREAVVVPPAGSDATLNCHGYGSSVTVTSTFGMVAAGEVLSFLAHGPDDFVALTEQSAPQTQI
jgi:tRNA threonylcarbamoyladenosine dehydratase